MANGISIARARDVDGERVRQLLASASLPTDGIDELNLLYIARRDDRVVGAAGLELYLPQALLRSVVVDAGARAAGIGGRLVRHLLEEASRVGATEIVLLTISAQAYFERFGFRTVDRSEISGGVLESREFTLLCPDTASAMKLDLHAGTGRER